MEPPTEPESDEVATDATTQPSAGVLGRRVAVVLLAGLLAVALASVALRSQPPVAVLGRTDVGSGMTSSGLPPAGLRVAWSHELPEEGWWSDPGRLVVDEDMALIAGRVVDVRTGEVLRTPEFGDGGPGRLGVRLSGHELVVVDRLLGTVVSRAELPAAVFEQPVWPSVRSGDVTMLAGDDGTWLVRDDGTVLADLPGWHETWQRRGDGDEVAAVVLRADLDMGSGPTGDLRLVSLRDGSTLLTREATPRDAVYATVDRDRAVLAWQRDAVDGSTELADPPVWDVELVDAVSGEVLLQREFAAHEPPRVLGRTPIGGTLLGVGVEQDVEIWEVEPGVGGAVLRTTVARGFSSPWSDGGGSALDGTAVFTDAGLLVHLASPEAVEARTLDGEVVWQRATGGAVGLLEDGGVVALLPQPGPDGLGNASSVIQLLDASDGTPLGAVRPSPALEQRVWGARPSAVVDGAVAIATTSGWPATGATDLGGARWLDLTTGEVHATADVLAPWTTEGTQLTGASWLHGVVAGPATGAGTPAVFGYADDGTLQLLQDGVMAALPLPAGATRDDGHLQPVGVTADRVAVWREAWDATGGVWSTYVVDRRTGTSLELPGVVGRLLTDDLLVSVEQDPVAWAAPAPLVGIDPVSGERRWTGPSVSPHGGTPLHDGALLVDGDGLRRTAVALDDGRTLWSYLPDEELLDGGVLAPTQVLLATTSGIVLALDRSTGAELWRRDVGAPVTSLTGAGDGALVATLAGELVVLDHAGQPVQRVTLDDVAMHAAALGDTVVVVHQRDNRVVGLRPDGAGFTTDDEVDLP